MAKDDQKQTPPSGTTGASLSAEFAKHQRSNLGEDLVMGLVPAIPAVWLGGEIGSVVPVVGTAVGAAIGAIVGVASGAIANHEDQQHNANEQEMAQVAKMDGYSSQIQAHYLTIHPNQWPPQTLDQFVQALRDKQVFDAVRSAAGKDASPSVIAALDQFSHIEQTRTDRTMTTKPAGENNTVVIPPR